jgi:Ca-activated chloride channel homolog
MDREKAEKLLAALIFDDLDEASKAEAMAYLQQDDELRERLTDMRMAFKVTSDAVQNGPAPVLDQRRLKRLARLAKEGQARSRIVVLRRLGAVAALLIVGVSAAFLGVLPRLSKVRNLSLPSQVADSGGTSLRTEMSEYDYAEPSSSEKPDAFGIAPTKEFGAKRPDSDEVALSDSGSQFDAYYQPRGALGQEALSANQALQDGNLTLGRGRHSRSAGLPPAEHPTPALSSIQAGEVARPDSPALAPLAQEAAPVALDAKENGKLNKHFWSAQPSRDDLGVEALEQKLAGDTDAKKTPGRSGLLDYTSSWKDLSPERRQDSDGEYGYRSLAQGVKNSPSSGVTAPTATGLESKERDSRRDYNWSEAAAQSGSQRGLGLDETQTMKRRPEELVTRSYDVSDLVRHDPTPGGLEGVYGEAAETPARTNFNMVVPYGWSGAITPDIAKSSRGRELTDEAIARANELSQSLARAKQEADQSPFGRSNNGMMGGGMMGGMGGMGGGMRGGAEGGAMGMGGGMMGGGGMGGRGGPAEMMKRMNGPAAPATRSAGNRYAQETGSLSEKGNATDPMPQAVDRLMTESESVPVLGDIPTLGGLHRDGIVATDKETRVLNNRAPRPTLQPSTPLPQIAQSHGAYGLPTDGRDVEFYAKIKTDSAESLDFQARTGDDNGITPDVASGITKEGARGAAPATQAPQLWGRGLAKAAEEQSLVTQDQISEALTEEFRAGRKASASSYSVAGSVAGTGIAPSSKPAPDASGSRQVYLDTKVVVVDKDDLMNLGVEWRWPTVQAGMFRPDNQVQDGLSRQSQAQFPGDVHIGYSKGDAFTNALEMQINLLEEQGEARVVANPTVMAQEGKVAELGGISDEYFMMVPEVDGDAGVGLSRAELEKIESSTKLSITPNIGDSDNINLDLSFELSEGIAQGRGTDLPVLVRRKTMDTVAVRDGGTVVLTRPPDGQSRMEGDKQVVVLITPRLVPQEVALPTEPQVEEHIDASEPEERTSAQADTDPIAHAKAEEDGFDLPPASRFKSVPVNPWVLAKQDHLSTFALDVDTASYSLCRRYINSGFLPPAGAVRMEEFVNSFDYNYAQRNKPTFAVHAQGAKSPFAKPGQDLTLLKIGVKARTVGRDQQRPAHLVVVVDASASMGQADRLPLVQHGLKLMVKKLSPTDRVSLVTCAQQARLHLEGVSAQQTERICQAIDAIQASGTTNLLAGLKLGYATAKRLFVPSQVNHVLLCSDGVANVGQTEAEAVLQAVAADRKQGITITSVGVGFGTYNDVLLEALANRGDGSYVFLDSLQQAHQVFVDQLTATLQGVAKDARIQVDFNAQRVRRYRLIGYENRDIEDKRFRDDTIDAGEVGSGQCSTALYEVELQGDPEAPLGTVFVRYRDVQTDQMQEIARPLSAKIIRSCTIEQAPRFFLAAGVGRFAEWLRQSEHVQTGDLPQIARIIEKVSGALPLDRDVRALAQLIRQAEHLPRAP